MRSLIMALISAIVMSTAILAANAAPLKAPANPVTSTANSNLVVPVHGRHRSCRRGPIYRWGIRARHRHIGRRVRICDRRWRRRPGRRYPRNWRRRGCFQIGPVWYCP